MTPEPKEKAKEPCPKEQYILEYFGLKWFNENLKMVLDMGTLTDLLYGFEQKIKKEIEKL